MASTALRPCGIIRFSGRAPQQAEAESLGQWLESSLVTTGRAPAEPAADEAVVSADLPQLRRELALTYQQARHSVRAPRGRFEADEA